MIVALSLLVATALGVFLSLVAEKTWIAGDGLLALLLSVSLLLSIFINMGVETLRDDVFVTIPAEEDVICILVNKEDPAKKVEDLKTYTFGIMEETDFAESEGMLQVLNEQYGMQCQVKTYTDLCEMLRALLEGTEIQATIFNPVYLSIASDMMDGENLQSKLRYVFYRTISELPGLMPPTTDPTTEPTVEPVDPQTGLEPFALYITGIDGGYSIASKSNSDVNIIVVVNPKEKQVMLLSTPRDYYIQMPVKGELQPDKLAHCGCYGIETSMETLENLYNIDLNYYFKVNFAGFQNIINALGGITVYSDHSFTFKENGYKIVIREAPKA